MTRYFKILGVAMVAAFAIAAASASMASADEFRSEGNQAVVLTGAQGTQNLLTTTVGTASCVAVNYSGTVAATPTASVTVAPTWIGCTCVGVGCTVDTNGCTFKLDIAGATTGTADIVCPAGSELTFTTTPCTIHVKPQKTLSTVTYVNKGAGTTRELEVLFELKNISYSHTEGTGLGKCTTGSSTTGTFKGSVLFTGETDTMTPAHVSIFVQ